MPVTALNKRLSHDKNPTGGTHQSRKDHVFNHAPSPGSLLTTVILSDWALRGGPEGDH
ncbi:hypothetical protein CEP54_015973, partial [Fusarium duplospermum]